MCDAERHFGVLGQFDLPAHPESIAAWCAACSPFFAESGKAGELRTVCAANGARWQEKRSCLDCLNERGTNRRIFLELRQKVASKVFNVR